MPTGAVYYSIFLTHRCVLINYFMLTLFCATKLQARSELIQVKFELTKKEEKKSIFNWISSLMRLTKSVVNGSASTRLEVELNVEYGTVSILVVTQVPGLKQLCKQIFGLLQYFVFDLFDNEIFAPDGCSLLAIWTPVVCCLLYIFVSLTAVLRCRESLWSIPS